MFVFRLEDTDAERDSEESYLALLDALSWLGLDYDEGPEVGGPYGPYRQSERRAIYRDVLERLVAAGEAYEAFSTAEEVEARHLAAGPQPQTGLRQLRSRPDRRAAGRATARGGSQAGDAAADARRADLGWTRPGRGRHDVRAGHGARLRADPRQRRPVVHVGQSGRRRADEDHPRVARRGSAALHTAPDRAVPRVDADRCHRSAFRSSATCPPCWARAPRSCPSAIRSPTCSCIATVDSFRRDC